MTVDRYCFLFFIYLFILWPFTLAYFYSFTTPANMLYVIGLGLSDERDITVKGLDAVRSCERIYLEAYTSILMVEKEKLVCLSCSHFIRYHFSATATTPHSPTPINNYLCIMNIGSILRQACHGGRPRDGRV